jgi:hypothetical protein
MSTTPLPNCPQDTPNRISEPHRMLQLTASLADGIPVDLQNALTGIDDRNVQLLVRTVLHASGQRPALLNP